MKYGILGGSFDPIHIGHMNMALQSMKEYGLDQVWLMPAGHSPNKDEEQMTSAADRLEMCKLAASEYDNIYVNLYEFMQEGTSYTYKTLTHFSEKCPEDDIYFIMGADSLDYLDKWCHPEIICDKAIILVVNRGEFEEKDLLNKIKEIQSLFPADIRIVHCPKMDISSTEIRKALMDNEAISEFLSPKVINYIRDKGLYKRK